MGAKAAISFFIVFFLVAGLWPFNFFISNGATETAQDGLRFRKPSTVYAETPTSALSGVREFVLVLDVTAGVAGKLGTILIAGENRWDYDFLLDQQGETFMAHFSGGKTYLEVPSALPEGKKTGITLAGSRDTLYCFVDGELRASVAREPDAPLTGSKPVPLVFGSDANGAFPWEGAVRSFAVFPGAPRIGLPGERLTDRMTVPAVVSFQFAESAVNQAGGRQDVILTLPTRFRPFHRLFLRGLSEYFGSKRLYVSDILANIVIFLPIGYLAVLILTRMGVRMDKAMLAAAAAGFCLSLTVEVLQAFLPGRNSSSMDLINNTLGAILGGIGTRFHPAFLAATKKWSLARVTRTGPPGAGSTTPRPDGRETHSLR